MNSSHVTAAIARWPDLLAAPAGISHADIKYADVIDSLYAG